MRYPVALLLLVACTACGGQRSPDVRYEPTPMDVVQTMLTLAEPRASDVVADLGCGDGRIVIEAVRRYGTRGLCVDIDPRRIAEATRNARDAGVLDRIRFVEGDLLRADLKDVTVVMLFLSPGLNRELRPRLQRELASGARVVSHWHDMGDWRATRIVRMRSDGRERPIYLWVLP
jgi:23S rRNA G2445 N2-methylase RlmL